ncbi:MAG: hypothetical protein CL920_18890 [Deltaproteobacteria bacterium]|nr:hypothetical protein [Deltaproteobacteria bacterium]MBU50752.1 hypothetical protein [Deltaproteobacteria bacterium]
MAERVAWITKKQEKGTNTLELHGENMQKRTSHWIQQERKDINMLSSSTPIAPSTRSLLAKHALFLCLFGGFLLLTWTTSCTGDTPKETTSQDGTTQEQVVETSADANTTDTQTKEPSTEPAPDTATQEAGPEANPEPVTESAPEKTPQESAPEQVADAKITNGECQSSSPRCPPGYACRDDVSPAVCHLQCDPDKSNTCPAGRLCLTLSTGEGICVEGTSVKKGETCDTQKICEQGLICVLSSPPTGTCYQRCTIDKTTCPTGEFCYLAHSQNGACIPGSAGSKKAGEACTKTTECEVGTTCFQAFQQTDRTCATLCDPAHPCPTGKTCAQLEGAPKDTGACK